MPRYAKKRDANEAEIVEALETAGCSVMKVDSTGHPDLLVGHPAMPPLLLEVKEPSMSGPNRRRSSGGAGALTAAQVAWWKRWTGPVPVVVTTGHEAELALANHVLRWGTPPAKP